MVSRAMQPNELLFTSSIYEVLLVGFTYICEVVAMTELEMVIHLYELVGLFAGPMSAESPRQTPKSDPALAAGGPFSKRTMTMESFSGKPSFWPFGRVVLRMNLGLNTVVKLKEPITTVSCLLVARLPVQL